MVGNYVMGDLEDEMKNVEIASEENSLTRINQEHREAEEPKVSAHSFSIIQQYHR